MNFTKGQWQDIIAAPVANLLEFFSHPYHTITITRWEVLKWSQNNQRKVG